jgi:hypothetical protein
VSFYILNKFHLKYFEGVRIIYEGRVKYYVLSGRRTPTKPVKRKQVSLKKKKKAYFSRTATSDSKSDKVSCFLQQHLQAAKSWSCWNSPGDSLSQWSVILLMTSQHVTSTAQWRHHLRKKSKHCISFYSPVTISQTLRGMKSCREVQQVRQRKCHIV